MRRVDLARNTFIPPPLATVVTTTVKGGGGEMADVSGKKFEKMGKKKDRVEDLRHQMHEFEVSSFGGDGFML